MTYADRIRALVWLPQARLQGAEDNPRIHNGDQRDALLGLLKRVGVADAVLAWIPDASARAELRALDRAAGVAWCNAYQGPVRLFDGHLRRDMLGKQEIATLITDCDERDARLLLAAMDQVAGMATIDVPKMSKLLAELKPFVAPEPLAMGFVDKLLKDIGNPSAQTLGGGAPEATELEAAPDQSEQAQTPFVVLVECDDEADQIAKIEDLLQRGWRCRALT